LIAAALLQDPAPVEAPPPDVRVLTGGVQAPEQPTGSSSATYEIAPRRLMSTDAPTRSVMAAVGQLVGVRSEETNYLIGFGLVVGLNGTGDSVNSLRNQIANLQKTFGNIVDPQQVTSKNAALVFVTADLPPGIRAGRRLPVRVATFGDAKSLQGGVLLPTDLRDMTGDLVYATAQGPLVLGGSSQEGEGASTQKNSVTVGTADGKVERSVHAPFVSEHGFIYLDAKASKGSSGNMDRIARAINHLYPGVASADNDGFGVTVQVPHDLPETLYRNFLDTMLALQVRPDSVSKIVVNERTGAIIIGDGVRIMPGVATFGGLTVSIAETPETSQPGPLSGGETETQPRTQLSVTEANNGLVRMPGATTMEEVVEVLNLLGATPLELVHVLEAMSHQGMLLADLEKM
jgi:flagellar P-ring protein precursor FlgI